MRRVLRVGLVVFALAAVRPDRSSADEATAHAGARVRVTLQTASGAGPPSSLTGRLTKLDEERLVVELAKPSRLLEVPRRDILSLELSQEPSRKGKGALIGFGVGLVTAFALEAAFSTCEDGSHGCSSVSDVLTYGTVIVALPGAAIGAAVAPGERWVRLPVHDKRVGESPALPRGVSVSWSVRF